MLSPSNPKAYGLRGQMFPFVAGAIGMISIALSYYLARSKGHVDPFPYTDITHCAIQFPEYIPFRVGLLCVLPLFVITWNIAKNYLNTISFRVRGHAEPKLANIGTVGFISSLALGVSTATISDGGDMNWTLHTIGATSFFIIAIYNCMVLGSVYKELWKYQQFCNKYSYLYKTTVKQIGYALLGVQVLCWLGLIDIGSLIEWLATFYILGFFFSLGFDFRNMDLMFIHK